MTSLSDQLVLMKQNLADVEEHLNKLQGGRKASSAKARASLMKLKKDSHSLRGEIMTYTKAMPVNARTKKAENVPIEEARQLQAIPEEEPDAVVEEKPKAKPKIRKSRAKKVEV
jgi:hypothetical protein